MGDKSLQVSRNGNFGVGLETRVEDMLIENCWGWVGGDRSLVVEQ